MHHPRQKTMPNTTMTQDIDTGRPSAPCAPEIEKSVLGLAVINPDAVIEKLRAAGGGAESFHIPAHSTIWKRLCELHDDGSTIDYMLLFQSLEDSGDLERVGGKEGLSGILGEACMEYALDAYIDKLLEKQNARQLYMGVLSLHALATGGASYEELAAKVGELNESTAGAMGERGKIYTLKDTLKGVMNRLEKQMQAGTHIEGVRTGFPALDDALGGLLAGGGYYLLAARPAEGKTAIALNIALAVAEQSRDTGESVLFVSAEMSHEMLGRRLLCSMAGQSWRGMCENGKTQESLAKITGAVKKLNKLNIKILQPSESVEACAAEVRQRARAGGLKLVIVDYAQLFRSEQSNDGNRVDDLERVSGTFRALANALPCPLLLLAQVNRTADKSADKRPGMADVKGCGAFEQDAEAVILLHRPEAHAANKEARQELRGKAELIISKNRNGETGTIPLEWRGGTQSFHDVPAPME